MTNKYKLPILLTGIFIASLVTAAGFSLYSKRIQNTTFNQSSPQLSQISQTNLPQPGQLYRDENTGFILEIPNNVTLDNTQPKSELMLSINTYSLEEIPFLGSFGSNATVAALNQDYQLLKQGEFGESWMNDYASTREVVAIDGNFIKTFIQYATAKDIVSISKVAIFYPNQNHLTTLILQAPLDNIATQNPQYFTTTPKGIEWQSPIPDTIDQFHANASGQALSSWNTTFDQLLQSIRLPQ